jgi:electron transfer flavoprotein beta subunit
MRCGSCRACRRRARGGLIFERVRAVADTDFAAAVNHVSLDAALDRSFDVTRTFVRWYLANADFAAIAFVHTVTAPSALRLLAYVAARVRLTWKDTCGRPVRRCTPYGRNAPPGRPVEPSADDLVDRAVRARDEHAIKPRRACGAWLTGDYVLAAASMPSRLRPGDSVGHHVRLTRRAGAVQLDHQGPCSMHRPRGTAAPRARCRHPDHCTCTIDCRPKGEGAYCVKCVKQVPDWDIPPASFNVDEAAKKVVPPPGVASVTSQFDAIAVEAAMRIKDADASAKVTIMSLGAATAREVIKQGLAMGADDGVLIVDDAFSNLDSNGVATVLSAAVKQLGDVDLVLTGRQAVDWDFGVTGTLIAQMIGAPVVTFAKSVTVAGGNVTVQRVLPDAVETIEAPLPAVVTVSNELGEPRYPKLQQIMAAGKKPVANFSAADLGLDARALPRA